MLYTRAHTSTEMTYEELKGEIPGLSLETVYRNLKLLCEMGLVRRGAIHNYTERYDDCCSDHVHFHCCQCGRIDDIDGIDRDFVKISIPLFRDISCPNFS